MVPYPRWPKIGHSTSTQALIFWKYLNCLKQWTIMCIYLTEISIMSSQSKFSLYSLFQWFVFPSTWFFCCFNYLKQNSLVVRLDYFGCGEHLKLLRSNLFDVIWGLFSIFEKIFQFCSASITVSIRHFWESGKPSILASNFGLLALSWASLQSKLLYKVKRCKEGLTVIIKKQLSTKKHFFSRV